MRVESLEDRLVPANIVPEEQLFVYLLNRARHDPAAYALEANLAANGVSLAGVASRPALAVNDLLFDSTDVHAQDMANNNYFAHTSPVTGLTPNQLVRNTGYVLPGFYPVQANNVESIAAGTVFDDSFNTSSSDTAAARVLKLLIEDLNTSPPAHRIQLLAIDTDPNFGNFFVSHREIGVGHAFGAGAQFGNYWSIHTAFTNDTDKFLTGVVYNDANSNGRYDLNEGLSGVTVTLDGGTSVQTNAQGGWSINVSGIAAGTSHTVTAAGGGFTGTGTSNVTIGSSNIEIDFNSGNANGLVDFGGFNHAPTFNVTAIPALASIPEDTANPAGVLLSTLVSPSINDTDVGDPRGIAITAVTGAGTWQFSNDNGANWNNFVAVSTSAAMLLPDSDMVRFLPNANANGSANFTFRAWDQTTGTIEGSADLHLSSAVGGKTAFSSTTKIVSTTVTPVNDAPVLAAITPTLASFKEDTAPASVAVSSLIAGAITDADTGALKGIAVTAVDNSFGNWQFSINGGTTFTNFGSPSDTTARLLRDTDRVRFIPLANANGTATFTFHAWDRTAGTAGGTFDASVTGDPTAFSVNLATASVTVTAVNDAPVLATTGTVALTPVLVNDGNPAGDTVASLAGGFISDVDGPGSGIAVIGLTGNSSGAWQFSTDGGANWTPFLSVTASTARLLDASDMIRFVPNVNYTLTSASVAKPTFSFRAWDETTGIAGLTGNASTVGGSTAFSAASRSGSVVVNTAPLLDNSGSPALANVKEDAAASASSTVATLIGPAISDTGTGTLKGIAVIGIDNSNGKWQFSTDGGLTFKNFVTPSANVATLLRDTDRLRFVPNKNFNGTSSFTFVAWDRTMGSAGLTTNASVTDGTTAFSLNQETAGITITPVNDAPVLAAGTPVLAFAVGNTTPPGVTVASLVGSSITDVDGPAVPQGIAVIGVTGSTNGQWQFSTDGVNFSNFGAPSGSAARLLDATALVRFAPNVAYTMTTAASVLPTLTYRAWDETTGVAGLTASIPATGGTTAFSSTTQVAKARVNDAPTLTPAAPTIGTILSNQTFTLTVTTLLGGSVTDAGTGALKGIAVTGFTNTTGGKWLYSADGGVTFKTLTIASPAQGLLLRATDKLRYVPFAGNTGTPTLTYFAWDQTTGTTGKTADLTAGGATGGQTAFSTATDTATLNVN